MKIQEPDREEVLRRMRALGLDKMTPRYTMIVPELKREEKGLAEMQSIAQSYFSEGF